MEPRRTPAWTFIQEECGTFKNTYFFLSLRKSFERRNSLPDIPCFNLKMRLPYLWYVKKHTSKFIPSSNDSYVP